ncbi:BUD22-domain-containing protein [Fimicolochytrium jonesii]|uniref:BUD22-domain-containing protein n=1 Tax=Fimicolochytrium jonesii TaxID=1396493 RepID=UPI0022FF4463|nr:BUD22-domain-containing protein [Fimicolochytrium jonesii]KAI8825963.1 BUD22-domain-containing protein [Fimicolochytrium jonesii]
MSPPEAVPMEVASTPASNAATTTTQPHEPDWDKLADKLRRKLHHIQVSLKRSGKKGKAFVLRALLKKARFYRHKLDNPQKPKAKDDGEEEDEEEKAAKAQAVKEEWERQLRKFEEQLDALKTLDTATLLQSTFLSALKKSTLPDTDRLIGYWDTRDGSGGVEGAAEADSDAAGETHTPRTKSTDPQRSLTPLEQRIATAAPVEAAVKEAIEDLFVIITGRTSTGARAVKKSQLAKQAKENTKTKTKTDTALKRKRGVKDHDDDGDSDSDTAKRRPKLASTFVTALGGGDDSADEDAAANDSDDFSMSEYGSDAAFSGDESDAWEQNDKKLKKEVVKKNRPGQQARRARAERQFGKKAKHILSGKKSTTEHYEEKRKATFKPSRGAAAKTDVRHHSYQRPATGESAAPAKGNTKAEPLHPSWEAKRKAKEAQTAAMEEANKKAKKIVFDNDSD